MAVLSIEEDKLGDDRFEPESGPLSRRVAAGLAKIGLAIKHRAWHEAGELGISPLQGQILEVLRASANRALTLTALADRLAVTLATTSDAVRVLHRKGLVEKMPSPADRRAVLVTLTGQGAIEADRVAGWPDFLARAVDSLTPAEQVTFLRALLTMIRDLQEHGQIPVSRMCLTCRFFQPNRYPGAIQPHHCAFVDQPFGDRALRLECGDHQPSPNPTALWAALANTGKESQR